MASDQYGALPAGFDPNDPANAEIMRLRQQNMQAQGQVSSNPFFSGPAYDPAAAQAGTGRGALAIRGNEVGYYGNGQWNSLGAAPQNGTPEFQQFVQQASWEGDQEAPMMAAQAQMPAPTTKSYGYAQPPSWAQTAPVQQPQQQPQAPMTATVKPWGGGLFSPPFRPQGGLLGGSSGGLGAGVGSFGSGNRGMGFMGQFPMNNFFSRFWGK